MDELVGARLAQGSEAAMAAGTRAVLARFAALGLDAGAAWDLDDVLDACSQAGFLGAEPAQP
jgi:hypothetical protein